MLGCEGREAMCCENATRPDGHEADGRPVYCNERDFTTTPQDHDKAVEDAKRRSLQLDQSDYGTLRVDKYAIDTLIEAVEARCNARFAALAVKWREESKEAHKSDCFFSGTLKSCARELEQLLKEANHE